MARKSKQPGGHNPLTAHERKKYGGDYGTATARLGKETQYAFANCGLSLHPSRDRPVATPSGYIYERSAMLEYLLTKTQELKRQQRDYESHLASLEASQNKKEETKRKAKVRDFENSQKVTSAKKQKLETNVLKRTSYWLADMQPTKDDGIRSVPSSTPPPPKRPPSPNTSRPLRRKDLIELDLKRNPTSEAVLCAISDKEISTQPALALVTKAERAQVVLEQVYKDLTKNDDDNNKDNKLCPVTGKKIKQILKLQRGGSSFASNDGRSVEAKKYRPTMT